MPNSALEIVGGTLPQAGFRFWRNRDMTLCPHCQKILPSITSRHKAICPGWPKALPPDPCVCGHISTSGTQMKRHKRECILWQSRDPETAKAESLAKRSATSLARYGVEDPTHAPEVVERRKATNLQRYGAENPFAKEASTFQKVQDSIEGKRPVLKGSDNPFSRPEIQEKVRQSMVAKYGAENPQQVSDIRERTRKTTTDRYGGELMRSPIIREKVNATNLARYGTTEPARTPEVIERARQTNLARYGVEWTNQDPSVRRRQLDTVLARYGNEYYFASEEGKREVRAALMGRYGVEFPSQINGFWDKAVATFRARYGVDHPLQLEEFLSKQRATNTERYGTPFPGLRMKGPNLFESSIHKLAPSLLFTGDGMYWHHLPKLNHHKNPDFILPGPDPENHKKGVTKVVEGFGDFWHSRMFTGRAPFDHEQELIDAYADIGIHCLVVWEGEMKRDPEAVRERLRLFLSV